MKTTKQKSNSLHDINSFQIKISTSDKIIYLNELYSRKCGYEVQDLIEKPFATLFHADMPKVILRMLTNRLKKNKSMQLFQKNKTRQGGYFWTYSIYSVTLNKHKSITGYTCKSAYIKINEKDKIAKLYNILSKIEEKKQDNLDISKRYLIGYLENKKTNYNEFIENLFLDSIHKDSLKEARNFIESSEKNRQPVNDIDVAKMNTLASTDLKEIDSKVINILLKGA